MDISELSIPWVDSPFFEKLLARSELDEETKGMVRTFASDGYLTLDPEIPDFDEVSAGVLADLSRRSDYPLRATNAWMRSEGVRLLAVAAAADSLPSRADSNADT